MPLYQYTCPTCSTAWESMATVSARDAMTCSDCGAVAQRHITGAVPVGALFDKKVVIGQKRFDTNADARAYESKIAADGGFYVVSANGREAREHFEEAREASERTASEFGFRSPEHQQRETRRMRRMGAFARR